MKLLEKNRGSKNLSIYTLQEIALQDLSSSINTISTETYSVSSSLAFCFMLCVLIQRIFTYLSLSSYVAQLIKIYQEITENILIKCFLCYESIFQVFCLYIHIFKWHMYSLKGGMRMRSHGTSAL